MTINGSQMHREHPRVRRGGPQAAVYGRMDRFDGILLHANVNKSGLKEILKWRVLPNC